VPQRNSEASEIEESVVGGESMFMTNQQSPELTEPGIGSLYDPAAFVTPHFASIFMVIFP
jgi:hypothetical protein